MKMQLLENIPKKDIFQAPDGYFDNLPGRIQNRLKVGEAKRISWTEKPAFRLGLAAMVIALIVLISFLILQPKTYLIQKDLSAISDDELFQYIELSEITFVDISRELEVSGDIYDKMIDEHFSFERDSIEVDVLMDLEPYTDELL